MAVPHRATLPPSQTGATAEIFRDCGEVVVLLCVRDIIVVYAALYCLYFLYCQSSVLKSQSTPPHPSSPPDSIHGRCHASCFGHDSKTAHYRSSASPH